MPKIKKIYDNIVIIEGNYKYKQGMLFDLAKDVKGYLIFANENEASLVIIGDPSLIDKDYTVVKESQDKISDIPIYSNYFGSIISSFGHILETDDKKPGKMLGYGKLDNSSPSILDRIGLTNPLKTGILSIDTMIPIGRGQRELIIGDRSTGKSTIAINSIINQKDKNIKSIYIAVGQKRSSVINTYKTLKSNNSINDTIIIFASPDSVAEQFFAPKVGMAIAEFFAYRGEDVLVVIDDLTKHANIYREIALSIDKTPGRETYPTDIFHEHAKLLERSGRFNEKYNNGSITCLPIVETIQGDVASIIPSNAISITDGQIFTSSQMANNSEFPAIDIGLSVSRTGSSVQSLKLKEISKGLKAFYLELFDIKKFADMSIDISDEMKRKIRNWYGISNLIIQYGNEGYSEEQIEILIEMFKMNVLSRIKKTNKFSYVFIQYCKKNIAAQKFLKMLRNDEFKDKGHFHKSIEVVFGSLAKVASNLKNGIISEEEYNLLKGDV